MTDTIPDNNTAQQIMDDISEPDAPQPIQALLAKASQRIGPIAQADQFGEPGSRTSYRYRGIERILRHAQPIFAELGIVPVPKVLDRDVEQVLVGSGKPWRLVSLTVRYRFYGPAGDHIDAVTVGEGFDGGDKAANKAMTNAFKYAMLQVLQINDGDLRESDAEAPPELTDVSRARRARRPNSSSTPPSAAPPEPTSRAAKLARLSRDHGGTHAAGVAAILSAIDSVPQDKERKDIQDLFVAHFERGPYDLKPDELPEARAWVDGMVAAAKEPKEAGS